MNKKIDKSIVLLFGLFIYFRVFTALSCLPRCALARGSGTQPGVRGRGIPACAGMTTEKVNPKGKYYPFNYSTV